MTAREALQAAEKATNPAPAPKVPFVQKPKPASKAPAVPAAAPKVAAKPVVAKAPAVPAPIEPAPVATVEVPVQPVAAAANTVPDGKVAQQTPSLDINAPEKEEPVLTATAEGKNTVNDVIENTRKYTEDAKTRFQSAFTDLNEKAKSGVEKSTKAIEEMAEIAKGNVEAIVESGKIAAKGVEAMGQDAAEYGRLTFEKASATMKSLAAAKSPTEFFQLQSEMLSSAFDAFAKESAKTSEALLKLAGEVAQPISSRVSIVTDKVKSLAA
ncbi:MAG: phasin family protein [Sphingobium sp.]|nr:phasin family protein [Sphingobium sp.]